MDSHVKSNQRMLETAQNEGRDEIPIEEKNLESDPNSTESVSNHEIDSQEVVDMESNPERRCPQKDQIVINSVAAENRITSSPLVLQSEANKMAAKEMKTACQSGEPATA